MTPPLRACAMINIYNITSGKWCDLTEFQEATETIAVTHRGGSFYDRINVIYTALILFVYMPCSHDSQLLREARLTVFLPLKKFCLA